MRLGDIDALLNEVRNNKELYERERVYLEGLLLNAPTVEAIPTELHEKIMDKVEGELLECQSNLRPQGEWIFRQGVTCGGYYKCNKCGEVERAEKNYCPNCGADMRGEEE